MLGDHALWGKTVFYRQSVTVPCILRPPGGITGRVSNALVELIDVPATLRDIAGAEPLDSAMGCSLCEHLTSDSTGKEAIVSDLFGQTMLRTRHHKLVFGTVDKRPHQLFDLEGDPDERENRVFDAPRHRAARPLDGTVRRPHRSDRVRALPGLREAIRQPQLAAGEPINPPSTPPARRSRWSKGDWSCRTDVFPAVRGVAASPFGQRCARPFR